jgi:hypothetical protein
MIGALLNVLSHDTDGDFVNALGLDLEAHGTGYFIQFISVCNFLLQELFPDHTRLAPAADHPQKHKWPVNPFRQHQRVMLMASRDEQAEGGLFRHRFLEKFVPRSHAQAGGRWKDIVIGQIGAIIEDGHVKIQLQGERRDSLCDMAGTGDPKGEWWRDGFLVTPCAARFGLGPRDGEIFLNAPAPGSIGLSKSAPQAGG